MNAAFLLVTTAWLAGADQPAAPAATADPPAATASCCGGGCGGGCGHGFLDRLRGLFQHGDCCETSCKTSCAKECKPACPTKCVKECKPVCEKSCCDSCRPRLFEKLRGLFHRDCCDSGCKGSCGSCCDTCRRGLLSRLRDWFHSRRCCQDTCCGDGVTTPATAPGAEPVGPPKDAPKKMPSPAKEVQLINPAPGLNPTANVTIETETKSPFELHRRYVSRVDRAPDYSWLTGQLFYVHADGGLWVLRYAPLWKEDPNGGSMVLARDLRMDNYHEGDLVTVHGDIISQHGSEFLGGPLYQVRSIKLIEHTGE